MLVAGYWLLVTGGWWMGGCRAGAAGEGWVPGLGFRVSAMHLAAGVRVDPESGSTLNTSISIPISISGKA
jgi:hypothetical protein